MAVVAAEATAGTQAAQGAPWARAARSFEAALAPELDRAAARAASLGGGDGGPRVGDVLVAHPISCVSQPLLHQAVALLVARDERGWVGLVLNKLLLDGAAATTPLGDALRRERGGAAAARRGADAPWARRPLRLGGDCLPADDGAAFFAPPPGGLLRRDSADLSGAFSLPAIMSFEASRGGERPSTRPLHRLFIRRILCEQKTSPLGPH